MPGIVLTFPILASKVEAWRRFCQEMAGSRRRPYESSRRRLGITREQWALVESSYGAVAITTLEADDIGVALNMIAASELPFDAWYRERVEELHGVSLAGYEHGVQSVPLPQNQQVLFEWVRGPASPPPKS